MSNIIYKRPAERKCFCRGCDKTLSKGDTIISTYTHRNRGHHIIFCLECAEVIGNMSMDKEDNIEYKLRGGE